MIKLKISKVQVYLILDRKIGVVELNFYMRGLSNIDMPKIGKLGNERINS